MDLNLQSTFFAVLLAAIAAAYAAVGQAGAVGYIAAMGIAGFAPDVIRPTALALNTMVAIIGTIRFARAGYLTWRGTYPFFILGLPFSVLGGAIHVPASIYKPVMGTLLILAAWQMAKSARSAASLDERTLPYPPMLPAIVTGAIVSLVAGVTGIGGGILITPIVLGLHWLNTRRAAGVSSVFNLLNSSAALAGVWSTSTVMSPQLPSWLIAVAAGAIFGTWLGVKHLSPGMVRYVLSALLLVGGIWMLLDIAR